MSLNKLDLVSVEGLDEIARAVERSRAAIEAVAVSARERMAEQFRQIERRGRDLEEEAEEAQRAIDSLDEDDSGDDEFERLEDALKQVRNFRQTAGECAMLRRRFEAGLGTLTERGGVLTAQCARSFAEVARDARDYRGVRLEGTSSGLGGGSAPDPMAAQVGMASPTSNAPELPPGAAPMDVGPPLPKGFIWLDLEKLSERDFLTEPSDFRKEGPGKIKHGIGVLRDELIPMLATQPGLDAEAVKQIDEERGTRWDENGFVHPDSLTTIWSVFFNPDRSGDTLCVARKAVNGMPYLPGGRHRLGIAREMGIRYMPAKVVDA